MAEREIRPVFDGFLFLMHTSVFLFIPSEFVETTTTTTTTSSTLMTAEDFGLEGVGEAGGGGLQRRSSWKRFKETVKETVQGWVGSKEGTPSSSVPGIPSAVFPSEDLSTERIDVDHVLHDHNCYSYSGREDTEHHQGIMAGTRKRQSVPNVKALPTIVVTPESIIDQHGSAASSSSTPPQRPVRRSSTSAAKKNAARFRPAVSNPDVSRDEAVMSSVDSPISLLEDDPEAMLRKRMAVMKIKNAIMTMNAATAPATDDSALLAAAAAAKPATTSGRPTSLHRRKSDTSAFEAAAPRSRQQPNKGTNLQRSSSLKKPSKPRPMIWEHFDDLPSSSQHAKCRICHMNLSCKFNTGNLVRHLQLAHKDVYRRYQNKMEQQWTQSCLERSLK